MLFGGPRLNIDIASDVVWLYPVASGDPPIADTLIEGTVTLQLSTAQTISSLSIALVSPSYRSQSCELISGGQIGTEKLLDGRKRERLRLQMPVAIKNAKLPVGKHK